MGWNKKRVVIALQQMLFAIYFALLSNSNIANTSVKILMTICLNNKSRNEWMPIKMNKNHEYQNIV